MTRLTLDNTELKEDSLPSDPLDAFQRWFECAQSQNLPLPESCALASATLQGRPSVRIVLYKGMYQGSFTFFTNYDSRKSQELKANPYAALTFHWPSLERQIRIEGQVQQTPRSISEQYFSTRPRGSQVSAWASEQSGPVANRETLKRQTSHIEEKFSGYKEIPCPQNWGGFALQPESIEFWQGKADRLHDRFLYSRKIGSEVWRVERLSP